MQVAKKALKAEPAIITRSLDRVKHLLESIEQLTDPPLDLDSVFRRSNLFHSTSASHIQKMAQWLRTDLQLSEKDLRRCLSRSTGILTRSLVGASITSRAQLTPSQPVCYNSSFCSSV